jgi:hypothetical protein
MQFMVTRTYNSENRLRKQAELRQRIAAAAGRDPRPQGRAGHELRRHRGGSEGLAAHGLRPTFPRSTPCSTGCTRHVASRRRPPCPSDAILAAATLDDAAQRLVDAMEQQHLHFEPWLSWREDRVIPFLATLAGHVRDELASLVGRVLRQHAAPARTANRSPRGKPHFPSMPGTASRGGTVYRVRP